jgi:hypothetical protein
MVSGRYDARIGAGAIGALLGQTGFMAAWLEMTHDERAELMERVGRAAREGLSCLATQNRRRTKV